MHNRLIRRIVLAAFSIALLILGLAIGSSSFIKDSSHTNGRVILKFETTWGEYLDWYLKENSDSAYYNPRPDLEKERKVRVVKTEYPKGLGSKNGYYNYAITLNVYDAATGEILTGEGHYSDKKK